jgi:hypothetical protein
MGKVEQCGLSLVDHAGDVGTDTNTRASILQITWEAALIWGLSIAMLVRAFSVKTRNFGRWSGDASSC